MKVGGIIIFAKQGEFTETGKIRGISKFVVED